MKTPDWSFQETAIRNTLSTFALNPTLKLGLILPTGAGKTRVALRIILSLLRGTRGHQSKVYWVTHRRLLRRQAHQELQTMISSGNQQICTGDVDALQTRVDFIMVSRLQEVLSDESHPPLFVVVDEAHHAAADSYAPIFNAPYPVPGLFLTATPNRTDALPIGIDEIAYTTTYRELEQRGVVVMPTFIDFPVDDFAWSDSQVAQLAEYLIDEAAGRFTKIIVIAPRIDRVTEFYDALVAALSAVSAHPLAYDDIGYIHGSGNSLQVDNADFLDIYSTKPRAILISAQLLIEGFNDPAIDTVVITYPTSSVLRLMQAAGRCVRHAANKEHSFVVQATNDELAYHFDNRWLYQEISDYLRPELIDHEYGSLDDLVDIVEQILGDHRVSTGSISDVLERIRAGNAGGIYRLLLYGLPYYGLADDFWTTSRWGAFLETDNNSFPFRYVFNRFSEHQADLSDPSDFLSREAARVGVAKSHHPRSLWRQLMHVLTASHLAKEEIHNSNYILGMSRPFKRHGTTTWLRYLTFHYTPTVADGLDEFLVECYNKKAVIERYLANSTDFVMVIRLSLPFEGFEAMLLNAPQASEFETIVTMLRELLRDTDPADRIATVAGRIPYLPTANLPMRLVLRIESFLRLNDYDAGVLLLHNNPEEGG